MLIIMKILISVGTLMIQVWVLKELIETEKFLRKKEPADATKTANAGTYEDDINAIDEFVDEFIDHQ